MNIIKINQMSNEFKMRKNNVLVSLDGLKSKEDEITESGIIIQTSQNKSDVTDRNCYGVVQAIGTEVTDVKNGDFVFWHITSGVEVEFRDGFFMILDEERILGISK